MVVENFLKYGKSSEISALTGISVSTIGNWQRQVKEGELKITLANVRKLKKGAERMGIALEV